MRLTREGPADDEVKIIALEFTLRDGFTQEELQMFPCSHTLSRARGPQQYEAIITLHCTDGDRQVRGWVTI